MMKVLMKLGSVVVVNVIDNSETLEQREVRLARRRDRDRTHRARLRAMEQHQHHLAANRFRVRF